MIVVKTFISYHHKDSNHGAARLQQALSWKFGKRNVFRDVEEVRAGDELPKYLESKIKGSHVVLAIIGASWPTRVSNKRDWVRQELEIAYEAGMRVIPVFLNEEGPPKQDDPGDGRQAEPAKGHSEEGIEQRPHERDNPEWRSKLLGTAGATLRDSKDWSHEVDRLIEDIQRPLLRKKWWLALIPSAAIAVLLLALLFALDIFIFDSKQEWDRRLPRWFSLTMALGQSISPPTFSEQVMVVAFDEETKEKSDPDRYKKEKEIQNYKLSKISNAESMPEKGEKQIVLALSDGTLWMRVFDREGQITNYGPDKLEETPLSIWLNNHLGRIEQGKLTEKERSNVVIQLAKHFKITPSWRDIRIEIIAKIVQGKPKVLVLDYAYDEEFVSLIEKALPTPPPHIVIGLDGRRPVDTGYLSKLPGFLLPSLAYGLESRGSVVDYPLAFQDDQKKQYYSMALVALAAKRGLPLPLDSKIVTLRDEDERVDLNNSEGLGVQIGCYSVRELPEGVKESPLLRDVTSIALMRIEVAENPSHVNWMSGEVVRALRNPTVFNDKLVIMGDHFTGVDTFQVWNRFSRQQKWGVDLHAEALSALINYTDPRQVDDKKQQLLIQPWMPVRLLLLIGSIIVGRALYLWARSSAFGESRITPKGMGVIVVLGMLVCLALSVLLYVQYRMTISVLWPILFSALTWRLSRRVGEISGYLKIWRGN